MADGRTAKRRRSDAGVAPSNAAYGSAVQPTAAAPTHIVPPPIQLRAPPAGSRAAAANARGGTMSTPVLVGTPPAPGTPQDGFIEAASAGLVAAAEAAPALSTPASARSPLSDLNSRIEAYIRAHASVVRLIFCAFSSLTRHQVEMFEPNSLGTVFCLDVSAPIASPDTTSLAAAIASAAAQLPASDHPALLSSLAAHLFQCRHDTPRTQAILLLIRHLVSSSSPSAVDSLTRSLCDHLNPRTPDAWQPLCAALRLTQPWPRDTQKILLKALAMSVSSLGSMLASHQPEGNRDAGETGAALRTACVLLHELVAWPDSTMAVGSVGQLAAFASTHWILAPIVEQVKMRRAAVAKLLYPSGKKRKKYI